MIEHWKHRRKCCMERKESEYLPQGKDLKHTKFEVSLIHSRFCRYMLCRLHHQHAYTTGLCANTIHTWRGLPRWGVGTDPSGTDNMRLVICLALSRSALLPGGMVAPHMPCLILLTMYLVSVLCTAASRVPIANGQGMYHFEPLTLQ